MTRYYEANDKSHCSCKESMPVRNVHQLKRTIDAYLPTYIFIGEALQNALLAVREVGSGQTKISDPRL